MIVTVQEAKEYLRVDFPDDDMLIEHFLGIAQKLCMSIARYEDEGTFVEECVEAKIAILYATGYLYEHREEADHHALTITLRSLLFGARKEAF
jgi:uncharacterized phage protein (predicted DNA packaging)